MKEIFGLLTTKPEPTTKITRSSLSNLIRGQVAEYSNHQLCTTVLLKDKFLEAVDRPDITAEERVALIEWTTYIFGNEKQVPLSLVLVRCNSMVHFTDIKEPLDSIIEVNRGVVVSSVNVAPSLYLNVGMKMKGICDGKYRVGLNGSLTIIQ